MKRCKWQIASSIILMFAVLVGAQVFEREISKKHVRIDNNNVVIVQIDYEKHGKIESAKTTERLSRFDKGFSDYVKAELKPIKSAKEKKELKWFLDQQETKCLKHALVKKALVGYLNGQPLIWQFTGMKDIKITNEVRSIFKRSDIWEIVWEVSNLSTASRGKMK